MVICDCAEFTLWVFLYFDCKVLDNGFDFVLLKNVTPKTE